MISGLDTTLAFEQIRSGFETSDTVANRRDTITPLQWCCLRDAAAGNTLAATTHLQHLWGEAEDGAIFHSSGVLRTLERKGFLRRIGKSRYVASPSTAQALMLAMRPR
jgi:hypothetical protein